LEHERELQSVYGETRKRETDSRLSETEIDQCSYFLRTKKGLLTFYCWVLTFYCWGDMELRHNIVVFIFGVVFAFAIIGILYWFSNEIIFNRKTFARFYSSSIAWVLLLDNRLIHRVYEPFLTGTIIATAFFIAFPIWESWKNGEWVWSDFDELKKARRHKRNKHYQHAVRAMGLSEEDAAKYVVWRRWREREERRANKANAKNV
jgi:hypothetical protein